MMLLLVSLESDFTAFLWSLIRFRFSPKTGKKKHLDTVGKVMAVELIKLKKPKGKEEVPKLLLI